MTFAAACSRLTGELADEATERRYRAMSRGRLLRHARITLLAVPALTFFNILAMVVIGSALMTPAFFQSSAAIVVVALIARYLIAGRARHHPDLVVAIVATTATVALAAVGIREPSMAVFIGAFLLVVPLAVVMLIPWRARTHFGFLLVHAAVALPAYLIMASVSAGLLELLAVCASAIGMSMIGKLLVSHEDRRTFMLRRALVTRRAQLAAANRALAASLRHDPLTGSRNRLRLTEDLVAVRSELGRDGMTWGLLLVDLDRFKSINDDFGHATGDAVLGAAVEAIKSALRPGDGIYRVGGEEFVVLLARVSAARAMAVAERLRQSVEDLAIANPRSRPSGVLTISIGLTMLDAHALDVDDDVLLARADRALYRAKAEGRNRIVAAGTLATPALRTEDGQNARVPAPRRAVVAGAS